MPTMPFARAQSLHRHHRGDELRYAGKADAFAEPSSRRSARSMAKLEVTPTSMVAAAQTTRPRREHALRAVALGEPAHRDLDERIDPEERREEPPDLLVVELQIVLDQRHGRRQRAAVDVVDEEHRSRAATRRGRARVYRRRGSSPRYPRWVWRPSSARVIRLLAVEHALQRVEVQIRPVAAADLAARRELRQRGAAPPSRARASSARPVDERQHLRLRGPLQEIQPLEGLRHGLADDEHAVIARA